MRRMKKTLSVIISGIVLLSAMSVGAASETDGAAQTHLSVTASEVHGGEYALYREQYQSVVRPSEEILLQANDIWQQQEQWEGAALDETAREGGAIVFDGSLAALTVQVELPSSGVYALELTYRNLDSVIRDAEVAVSINNAIPFKQAKEITIPKHYINNCAVVQDNQGNDARPSTIVADQWITYTLRDSGGLEGDFGFYLEAGTNQITLSFVDGLIAVGSLRLYNKTVLPTYQEYLKAHPVQSSGFAEEIQGESPAYRSSSVITLNYDRSGPKVTPNDPTALKLNTLGGSGWAVPNQYVAWNVTVKEAGLYRLQIRYRQNVVRGRSAYRRLYVNGEIPFAEADSLAFRFNDNWQTDWLGAEQPYLFYLNAGENEIRLEATCGSFVPTIQKASALSDDLRGLYTDIIMVTGMNPDPNRDYMLTDEIPTLIERFKAVIDELNALETLMKSIDGNDLTDDAATIRTLRVQLEGFVDAPASIAVRVTRFQSNISAYSDFVVGLKSQPLEIDRMCVASPDTASLITAPSFWDELVFQGNAFISSFVNDYSTVGNVKGEGKTIEAWVDYQAGAIGRDHAQIIMQLTDSLFTPKSGINVNIKLVQQALAPAILSGIGPDVAMYTGVSEPVNLAARGGLVNMKTMAGFEEFTKEFRDGAFTPFEYNGGVYGVPFTQSFPMLFCRTDIFADMGLTPPTTWDEFYDVMEEIQKNNMVVGIPNMTDGAMSTDNTIFAMFLYQNGGRFYTDDLSRTRFDEEVAVNTFRKWTDLYKNYGLPVSYSFYQRFRLGDMPMGVASYAMYNTLQVTAPEIEGLWEIYPMPGTVQEDGTVDNTVIASGMGTVILNVSKDPDAAWEYVKWLSGTEAQTQISLELEALLGPTGRLTPANVAAFDNLPWKKAAAANIASQWEKVQFIPQVPGNYYVERNLTNAFRKTVYYNYNYREALLEYNREMNIEIARKRKEFHLD